MMRLTLFTVGVLAMSVLLACSSPKAAFYTLSADSSLERTAPAIPVSVVVGPVTVPELVDRPQMVTRVASNEVTLNEFARWGESLKSDIARALAGDLAQLLGTDSVSVYQQSVAGPAWQVRVDVLRFDATLGDAVTIEALWSARPPKGTVPLTGRTLVHEAVKGPGYDAIAAADSRALADVSREIAAAIRQSPSQ